MRRVSRRAELQAGVFVLAVVGLVAGLMILLNHTIDVPIPARDHGVSPPPLTGNSKDRVGSWQPLATILGPGTRHTGPSAPLRDCATSARRGGAGLAGLEDSIVCSGPASSGIRLTGYQFAQPGEYTSGFAQLAADAGWRAAASGSRCPATSRTAMGQVPWQDPPAYPSHPGQVLDCDSSPRAGAPEFVWGMPGQRVVFTAVDTSPGASYGSLWAWLRSVRFD